MVWGEETGNIINWVDSECHRKQHDSEWLSMGTVGLPRIQAGSVKLPGHFAAPRRRYGDLWHVCSWWPHSMEQLPSGNTEEISHTPMNLCHRVSPTWWLITLGEKGRTANADVLRKVGGGLVKTLLSLFSSNHILGTRVSSWFLHTTGLILLN